MIKNNNLETNMKDLTPRCGTHDPQVNAHRWRPARALAALTAAGAVAMLAGCGSGGGDPIAPAPAAPRTLAESCAAFTPGSLPHGATVARPEIKPAAEGRAEVCVVRGTIVSSPSSTINWAVEMPAASSWNGKTLTIGGGGFDGFIPTDNPRTLGMIPASANPFVKISSDSGHQIQGFFPWATDDVALRNHAFEANHQALEVGTRLAEVFYGKRPTRRYMFGQSNGGRSGLVAAQRYPNDYDGVVAFEPAISQQGHEAVMGPALMKRIFSDRVNWLSPAKTALFAQAEIKACDELDGLKDGVIGNVEACTYVPTDLLCKGADNDTCLTTAEIDTIKLVYSDHTSPVLLADGYRGYPRFGRGGAATSDWSIFLFGEKFEERSAFDFMVGDEAAKVVTNNAATSLLTFDPTLYQTQWTRLSTLIDGTNPDLSAFAAKGGKMLIWYGMADACVSVYRTAEYLHNVSQRMGEGAARNVVRMVTSPHVGHALDGPGAGRFDWIAAIENWTEKGQPVDNLVATRFEADNTTAKFTRPLCEYPKFPRYKGSGDTTKADNFSCSVN